MINYAFEIRALSEQFIWTVEFYVMSLYKVMILAKIRYCIAFKASFVDINNFQRIAKLASL